MRDQRASGGTQNTRSARYSSGSSGSAPSSISSSSLACCSSKASEMYLRKISPSTTCLYSAASILLRSASAISQSFCSNSEPSVAPPLAIACCCRGISRPLVAAPAYSAVRVLGAELSYLLAPATHPAAHQEHSAALLNHVLGEGCGCGVQTESLPLGGLHIERAEGDPSTVASGNKKASIHGKAREAMNSAHENGDRCGSPGGGCIEGSPCPADLPPPEPVLILCEDRGRWTCPRS